LTLRRAQRNSHNVLPRGGYQPRQSPDVDYRNRLNSQIRQAGGRADILRQNRIARAVAEIALPFGPEEMDLDI